MAERAAIESLDALLRLRGALCVLAEDTTAALAEADSEILRTAGWLREDQRLHWKHEVHKRAELCARARSALKRKEAMKTPLGGRYSTVEEEKNLARAQRLLEQARQREANVRRWSRVLDDEAFAYKSVAQGLGQLVEGEIPKALARLDRMIAALEAYASATPAPVATDVETPIGGVGDGQAARGASVRREVPEAPDLAALGATLRRRAPTARQRSAAARVEGAAAALAARPALDEASRVALTDPAAAGPATGGRVGPPSPEQTALVAAGVATARRVWLLRTEPTQPDDSGWTIGSADDLSGDPANTKWAACRVADVLAARPDWHMLLGLAPGWLILLDGGAVEAFWRPDGTPGEPPADTRPGGRS